MITNANEDTNTLVSPVMDGANGLVLDTNASVSPNDTLLLAQNAPLRGCKEPVPSPKIGRPKKQDIVSKTKGHIAKRGRPPGEAAAMAEFKARLINSPKSKKVIEKIFDAALDDDHKNQSAAWKLLIERMMPVSMFEKGSGGKSAVTINISGLGAAVSTSTEEEPLEGEYDVEEDESDPE